MSQSVKQRLQALSTKVDVKELRPLIEAILTDLGVLRTPAAASIVDYTAGRAEIAKLVTDITTLATALDTLAAKLNLDGGVTDVDYFRLNAAAITAANPAAVTATAPAALTLTS